MLVNIYELAIIVLKILQQKNGQKHLFVLLTASKTNSEQTLLYFLICEYP